MTERSERSLDPDDWRTARAEAHALLDACLDHLEAARDRPWQPVDDTAKALLASALPRQGMSVEALREALENDVLPHGTGNTHPRFFGWVHGTGLYAGLLAEMAAATMNTNCGGRDHGAVYVERAVIDWCREIFGFPSTAGGLLTPGTSMASVLCLAAARQRILGPDSRSTGLDPARRLVGYAAAGAHSAIRKAFELLGLGSGALRAVPATADGGMDTAALREMIAADRKAGLEPFAVIATAGSVDTGAFDDLNALADAASDEALWLHVDGAFGAWARIAETPWRRLTDGIERADSLALDFHKWMYVQYDCGAALVRDGETLRETFATRPAYLAPQESGLGGGDPWFCDYGIDLSRGFRALKVWSALRCHGLEELGRKIGDNCRQASHMAACVKASALFELAAPVVSNVCCFRGRDPACDPLMAPVAARLQLDGEAVFSTTTLDGRPALRAAIVNHRTTLADIDHAVAAAERTLAAFSGQ